MFDFHDIEQNSPEWLDMRGGRLTSSKLGVIMANLGKSFGEPAKKYAIDIAIEQITDSPIPSEYSNSHMTRGHEQEPLARMEYEEVNFCDITNGGFFCTDFIGCSPDGLVSDCGLIEIKSVIPSVHYANVKRAGVDPAYKWQVIGNLKFTGREWIDFVSYCDLYPDDKKIYTHRLHSIDLEVEFEKIDSRVEEFELLVAESKEIILSGQYST